MNKHLIIFALILLLTACSPTPTAVPSSPTTNSNSPTTISATPPVPQEVIPTTVTQPTSTVVTAPDTSGALWLRVLSPPDEAVVNTPQVDIVGSAPAGAVLSVNDDILLVGDDQHFKTTISLDEGPNLIEIIASDDNGSETSIILAVTYEP